MYGSLLPSALNTWLPLSPTGKQRQSPSNQEEQRGKIFCLETAQDRFEDQAKGELASVPWPDSLAIIYVYFVKRFPSQACGLVVNTVGLIFWSAYISNNNK